MESTFKIFQWELLTDACRVCVNCINIDIVTSLEKCGMDNPCLASP